MDPFEYAVGLVSIVIGLAVADLGTSLHRLLRSAWRVRWDPLALLAALFAFLVITGMWFDFWSVRERPELLRYTFFLSIMAELLIVFLFAAAALPDDDKLDLKAFYAGNARYFWSLYAAFRLIYMGHWLFFWSISSRWASLAALWSFSVSIAPLLIAVPMIVWPQKRRLHYVLILLSIALNLAEFWSHTIS